MMMNSDRCEVLLNSLLSLCDEIDNLSMESIKDPSILEYMESIMEPELNFEGFIDIAINFFPIVESLIDNKTAKRYFKEAMNHQDTFNQDHITNGLMSMTVHDIAVESLNPASAEYNSSESESQKDSIEDNHNIIKNEKLAELLAICPPDADVNAVEYFLEKVHGNQLPPAATFILDNGMGAVMDMYKKECELLERNRQLQEDKEKAENEKLRKQMLNKFDEFTISEHQKKSQGQIRKQQKKCEKRVQKIANEEKSASRLRYFENQVVSRKGEKYHIIDDGKPEWDGGSRGRVKTKGKRGPGWV